MRDLPKYLTQDELRRFFDEITSPRDRALFPLIYHYGLRVDEAVTLTLDDLDLKTIASESGDSRMVSAERNPCGVTRRNFCVPTVVSKVILGRAVTFAKE